MAVIHDEASAHPSRTRSRRPAAEHDAARPRVARRPLIRPSA